MYIHGDMTTAKFAVIENPRIYQFKGRWTDYTERFAYAKVFEVTRDFIQDVSWMTKDHSYVIHFCHNGIEDICDDTPDIKTDGKSLLFAYDVFMMTRDEKSYTTEVLIRYTNQYYDYRYEDDNIYGFGFDDVTVDDVDNGITMAEPIVKTNIDRKAIYEGELADYQKRIEENHRREARELKKAQREREEHQEVEREKRERAKCEYEERAQREREAREERARIEREWRRRECEEREQRAREERERVQRAIEEREQREHEKRTREEYRKTLYKMRNDVCNWLVDVGNHIYTRQINDYSLPYAQLGDYKTASIDEIIKEHFGTKFYNLVHEHTCYYVPKDIYNRYGREQVDEDVCIAQTTTLNVSGIPMGVLVDGVVSLFNKYTMDMGLDIHRDMSVARLIQYDQLYAAKYIPNAKLISTDDGILFVCQLVPHELDISDGSVAMWFSEPKPEDAFDWDLMRWNEVHELTWLIRYNDGWLSTKTRVADFVREWKQTNKHVIDRVRHNEDAWWNVERLSFVNPKPNTNLLYVAYLPHTDVIKVGRTQNWESRENAYRRISGPTPETTGDMRLCYVYETPTVGDVAIDKWLLYCAEDHIKQFARKRMELVGGNEFFRGQPVQEFCIAVDGYFKTLTTQDIIRIRPEYEAKQFALQNNYHVERFLDALEQL